MENQAPHHFDQRLDQAMLSELYDGDLEHATVVFEQFLETSPMLMTEIKEHYETGNIEHFRQKVHKIKPIFSFVGLSQLTQQAEVLEIRCREIEHLNELAALYAAFNADYADGYAIIEDEIKSMSEQLN